MRFSKTGALGLFFGLLAVACGGPTVGDIAAQEITFTVTATASAPDVAALGDAQGGLGVTRAFVSVSHIDLIPCDLDTHDIALAARGYALLTTPPPSEAVETAVASYCDVRLDIAPLAKNKTDGVPSDASLYFEGKDADGKAFTLSSQSSTSLSFTTAEGSMFGDEPFLLGFDVSVWLAGLPLPDDMADMSAALLDSQLVQSAALYVDANGNQAIDPGEQTPIARAKLSR